MPVVLYRVDERLIHGQVVIGWGHELRPNRYVVVDDEIAASAWEQELYVLGAPEADTVFATVDEARAELEAWCSAPVRTVVLTRTIRSMRALLEGQGPGYAINLGGLHAGPDRIRVLDYLHLTAEDRDDLTALASEGVEVSARDLPNAPGVGLDTILSR
jgi:mannose/fructose/N-acetylgalactosamine-specific phosphotransferase system component IIB